MGCLPPINWCRISPPSKPMSWCFVVFSCPFSSHTLLRSLLSLSLCCFASHLTENHPTDDALISKHIRVTSGQVANFLAINYQQLNLKLQPWKWCLGGITFAPSVWKWPMKLDDDSNPTHGSSHPPFTCNPPETMVARSGNKITYIWSHKQWRCWGYLQQSNKINPNHTYLIYTYIPYLYI